MNKTVGLLRTIQLPNLWHFKPQCNRIHNICDQPQESGKGEFVLLADITRFVVDAFRKVGTKESHALQMARMLVTADLKGHFSHGLNRLGMYVEEIREGAVDPNAEPSVLKESVSTAYLSGNNGLGPVVGNLSMNLAISKAKSMGVSLVVAKGSNHYGICSWYTDRAVKCGMLGFTFTNTSPLAAPTGAKDKALGTNPMSFGAPGNDDDAFVLDMATTAVAVGKIELYMKHKHPIPLGWAVGPDGKATTDSKLAFEQGSLMPLGGVQEGHKGYALSLMVEALTGILAGACYGPFIRSWGNKDRDINLGQCFGCINPEFFAPGYRDRMSHLMKHLRNMNPVDPSRPVRIPGDKDASNIKHNIRQGAILYTSNQINWANDFAREYGISPLKPAEEMN